MNSKELGIFGIVFGYIIIFTLASITYPFLRVFLSFSTDILIAIVMGIYGLRFGMRLIFIQVFMTSAMLFEAEATFSSMLTSIFSSVYAETFYLFNPVLLFVFGTVFVFILNTIASISIYLILVRIGFAKRIRIILGM